MAGATLSTFDKVLKEEYLPGVQIQFHDKNPLYKMLKKASDLEVVGTKAKIAVETQRHLGHGQRAEDEDLPGAGNVAYTLIEPPLRHNYARVRITGPSMRTAKKGRRAFIMGLTSEIKGAERGMRRNVENQWNGDGSGCIATFSAAATSATQTVDNARMLDVGQVVDISNRSSGADIQASTSVSSISGKTVVFADSFTSVVATSGVFLENTIVGGTIRSMQGLLGIINDQDPSDVRSTVSNSLHGLAVASNSTWKSERLSNSGTNRDISTDLIRQLADGIDVRFGRDGEYCIYSNHAQFRKFANTLIPDRRYKGNQYKLQGGYTTLDFEGMKWFVGRQCLDNRIFMICKDKLKIYQLSPIQWADEDGAVLHRVADRDAYEAYLLYDAELGTSARAAHGVLEDLSE